LGVANPHAAEVERGTPAGEEHGTDDRDTRGKELAREQAKLGLIFLDMRRAAVDLAKLI
jgi:hypothetical protein